MREILQFVLYKLQIDNKTTFVPKDENLYDKSHFVFVRCFVIGS